ncbi:hypothetical protein N7456_006521 [Penicillium angulare]|uniref:Protein kinase domain-containing protein n=1 Tax=Penicillium angulare TaxID=116970 RepID=A0A9W9KBS2_9EURO|nr:hypothetical protein N7456_006521 [Penicillium angulare]
MSPIRSSTSRFSILLRKKPFPIPSPGPPCPSGILIDEEISPFYNPRNFYPAKPGEVLVDRYQIIVKVGWGVSSTVWFARDLQGRIEEPESIVALKIASCNSSLRAGDGEREVEEHISTVNPSHPGRSVIRTFMDSFELQSSEDRGHHSCLVYSPLREPLSMYQRRFEDKRMPLPLIKTYIRVLLTGLDYLHKECRTVHTDLKLDNIMVSFEDPIVLSDFMKSQLENPMAFKINSTGRPIYQCKNEFGPLKSLRSLPQLVDFGLATRVEEDDDWGVWPIQPDHARAPEVILGLGWQMPTDIWSLGVLLWDMIEGNTLFQNIHDQSGRYDAKYHLSEIIALVGSPAPEILQRYQLMRNYSWPEPIRVEREDGKICKTAEEYFCGPFFDNDGRFLYENLIPDRKLEDTVPSLEGEEREEFLDLVKGMLVWHPNFRKTAGELARHPFLQSK